MVIPVRREVHEYRAAREGVGLWFAIVPWPIKRDGCVQRLLARIGDYEQILFGFIEEREQFIDRAVFVLAANFGEFGERVEHRTRRAAREAIGPASHDADDVREREVKIAQAHLKFLIELFTRDSAAGFENLARAPGIGADENFDWVGCECGQRASPYLRGFLRPVFSLLFTSRFTRGAS